MSPDRCVSQYSTPDHDERAVFRPKKDMGGSSSCQPEMAGRALLDNIEPLMGGRCDRSPVMIRAGQAAYSSSTEFP